MDWIESLILGVVQGFTEFLPVSSDGHLALTQRLFARLLGQKHSAADDVFFDVMLHVGTTAAILFYYRRVIAQGYRGLLGTGPAEPGFERPRLVRVGLLAFVATLWLVPDALYFKKLIDQAFHSLTAIGVGFLVSAAMLALTARLSGGTKGPDEMTWIDALLIGLAQAFAPLPGVSRSGLTISAALALGLSRTWAVGFSLLLAVPAIAGAAVFELRKADPSTLSGDRIAQIAVATVIAGLVGYAAIAWLVRIVRGGRLWYFSVYLVMLGAAVLAWASADESPPPPQPVAQPVTRGP